MKCREGTLLPRSSTADSVVPKILLIRNSALCVEQSFQLELPSVEQGRSGPTFSGLMKEIFKGTSVECRRSEMLRWSGGREGTPSRDSELGKLWHWSVGYLSLP